MIRISSTSNGRQYSSESKADPVAKKSVGRQECYFGYRPASGHGDNRRSAEIEFGVAYNAAVENESLNEGRLHIREGRFEAPFKIVFDVLLGLLEEDQARISTKQAERMLGYLAKNYSLRPKPQTKSGPK